MKSSIFAFMFALIASVVMAQEQPITIIVLPPAPPTIASKMTFPGSIWTSNGVQTPSEKDFTSSTHVEQGVALMGFEAFGQFTGTYDSKGFDWNRRTIVGIGGRYTLRVPHGIVRASVSYMSEVRYVVPARFNGVSYLFESWLGWK